MKCDDARLLMNSAIDREISREDQSQLNDHLEHCEQCTVVYEELKYLKELMGEMEMKELPNNFEKELHLKLLEEKFLNSKEPAPEPASESKIRLLGKMRNVIRSHGHYVVVAAAIALIVILSNNPFQLGGYRGDQTASSKDEMFATAMNAESEAFGMAPEAPEMRKLDEATSSRNMDSDDFENAEINFADASGSTSNQLGETTSINEYRTDRMIIKSGNINLEIVDYDAILEDIKQNVNAWGGYIENESTSKRGYNIEDDLKYGSVIVRIPNDKFEEMMLLLKSYGNVMYDNVYAQDVTKEYRDTAQEVENLKLTESRFRELLSTATNMEDILAIENELTRIRSQINQYERRLKDWEVLVDLSSISVELNEVKSLEPFVEPIDDTLLGKAKHELIRTINGIRQFLENSFIWVVANSPIIILIGIVVLIWWFRNRKNSKATKIKK